MAERLSGIPVNTIMREITKMRCGKPASPATDELFRQIEYAGPQKPVAADPRSSEIETYRAQGLAVEGDYSTVRRITIMNGISGDSPEHPNVTVTPEVVKLNEGSPNEETVTIFRREGTVGF